MNMSHENMLNIDFFDTVITKYIFNVIQRKVK